MSSVKETKEAVVDLTYICSQVRFHLNYFEEEKKEMLILQYIKQFKNHGAVQDFPKGLEWFNVSEGLSLEQHLQGKIVLLDFFTYCCINCMHVLTDLEEIEKEVSVEDGLVVIFYYRKEILEIKDLDKILSLRLMILLIDLEKRIVSTIAGTGSQGCDRVGGRHGTDQALSSPWDVAIYHHKYKDTTVPVLLIVIAGTHQIWALFLEDTIWWKEKKYPAGTCAAIVGNGQEENRNNTYPHAAALAQPSGIAVVQECKVAFLADSESSTIRRLHLDSGQVSAVCGGDKNPTNLYAFGDADGKGHLAKLQHPLGVTWNHLDKRIYVADTYNHKIKSVDTTTGHCKTLFGDGKPDRTFTFDEPSDLAVSPNGNILYVADTNNHALKIIDLKNEKISTMPIVSRRDSNRNTDSVFTFDTTVNARGGELNISFNIVFSNDLKLNAGAPQEWQVSLPANTWTAKSLTGRLSTPISVKLPEEETCNQLPVTLNIMACTADSCVPLKLSVLFNVQRKADAPTVVTEEKELVIG
ncbi:NHL repeat-containing protein 2 [Cyphomyrmex costatus]|uniref:NHL repeat-containing protein 2 n=1 Tax=Cyphomyrmex costatus TaxID=456900 RepID=A0A195C9N5_9HYME|nr:NHL repeat-containing protein 2 [Cyphomyrmex costatus]